MVSAVGNKTDVRKSFSAFHNKINTLLNRHAPLKLLSKRSLRGAQKPWITKGISRLIKIKDALFYSGDTTAYKLYRNKILTPMGIISNTKKTSEGMNGSQTGNERSLRKWTLSNVRQGTKVSSSSSEFLDAVNKYFSSIGHNLASKMPNPLKNFTNIYQR